MPPASVSTVRTSWRNLRRAGLAVLVGVVLTAVLAPVATAGPCARTYSYAGLVSAKSGHGIRADLRSESAPAVQFGFVAGWVGVSGRGAWLQVGYTGFVGGHQRLYYEVKLAGEQQPRATIVQEIQPGESHRVAVRESATQRNWWEAWVDGRRISPPFYLGSSHRRLQPMATAESWNGGRGNCNDLTYRFSRLALAGRPGGSWGKFAVAYDMQDPGYRVQRTSNGFVARARAGVL